MDARLDMEDSFLHSPAHIQHAQQRHHMPKGQGERRADLKETTMGRRGNGRGLCPVMSPPDQVAREEACTLRGGERLLEEGSARMKVSTARRGVCWAGEPWLPQPAC